MSGHVPPPVEAGDEPMRTVEEALETVLAAIPRPTEPETAWIFDALGRVAAEDARSTTDLPPWDNAAMDGYAVRSADLVGATEAEPVSLAVTGDVAAGSDPSGVRVVRGTAVRIATGAPIPAGADAVVQVELTTPADPSGAPAGARGRDATGPVPATCLIHRAVPPGASIRAAASDLRRGDIVVAAGSAIGPATVAIAAGAGLDHLSVHRRPIVGVLATGDELRAPGEPLGAAGIPDANGPGLMALVRDAGGDARSLGTARDRLEDVTARIGAGLAERPDVLIVSGGVSVGPYDHVRRAFEAFGPVALWRVAVQPGRPFAFGTTGRPGGGTPILLFGLPGNPVSTFVTFELFVRPALRRLSGLARLGRPRDRAVLLDRTPKAAGRRAYVRVVAARGSDGSPLRDERGRVRVSLAGGTPGQGSHVLSALAAADAFAVIPETVDVHEAGGEVELWWLDRP
ncbi:MAG TPA: gephyrin-like molybdotransferase Glp [Candidatus Sulfomarinibacteraceae bacterium]|nr:gephyrin-like molybdotransferase Glp [Candidatus Sulfomarinibacteraceae bacterium]